MKKFDSYRYSLIIFFSTQTLFAQSQSSIEQKKAEQLSLKTFELITTAGAVLRYQLDLNFVDGLRNNNHNFSGKERVLWKVNADNTTTISLGANDLRIDSVKNNGKVVSFDAVTSPGKLMITLDRTYMKGDTVILDIAYAHTSTNNIGYYYYDKDILNGTLERLAYTFTEPYDSPYWFPCFNDPSVKAPCSINSTVPAGYLAASNGLLKNQIDNGDGTITFQWEERHPIAMYLMSVTISQYATFSHYYRRMTNPSDSIEIKYYIWRADSAGATYNAVTAFRNVLDMMKFYSTIFGEYPFDKYGMAAVYPFGAGGMEHQTMTTIHRSWLANGGSQDGIAHELAHQWWGDLVTCATWADIWLNEGFATYSDALWEEHFYGTQAFRTLMANIQSFTAPSWQYPVYNPPLQYLFGNAVYNKGAWVLHMLRNVLGDSTFFNVFKIYRQRFQSAAATTDDFTSAATTAAGKDMKWFFDQWIYQSGWPVYSVQWYSQKLLDGTYRTFINVKQIQKTKFQDNTLFRMPIELRISTLRSDTLVQFANDSLTQSYMVVLADKPLSLEFDPSNKILKQVNAIIELPQGSPEVPSTYSLYQNYPNPFNPSTTIQYELPKQSYVTLKIYDVFGQEVATLVSEVQREGRYSVQWDGRNKSGVQVSSGIYFYQLKAADATPGSAQSFVQAKPMALIK